MKMVLKQSLVIPKEDFYKRLDLVVVRLLDFIMIKQKGLLKKLQIPKLMIINLIKMEI